MSCKAERNKGIKKGRRKAAKYEEKRDVKVNREE